MMHAVIQYSTLQYNAVQSSVIHYYCITTLIEQYSNTVLQCNTVEGIAVIQQYNNIVIQ